MDGEFGFVCVKDTALTFMQLLQTQSNKQFHSICDINLNNFTNLDHIHSI